MIECVVHSISRHTGAQEGTQVLPCAVISYVSAGLEEMTVDGVAAAAPFIALLPAGASVTYRYSERREQWAVLLQLPGLTPAEGGMVRVDGSGAGDTFLLPLFTPIVSEHISGWEGEFLRLREAHQAPCAANRMRVRLGIGNVIRYVIDQRRDIFPSPAAKLRWLIDEDQEMRLSLDELSRQCGYSPSRLRVLFEREVGLSPQAYRNQRRMSLAADLLCNSDLRVREVSVRVGCRQVSHFCALFKSAFGLTPTAYRNHYQWGR